MRITKFSFGLASRQLKLTQALAASQVCIFQAGKENKLFHLLL